MGARLSEFWLQWQRLGASPWIVSILRKGFKLKFREAPPLSSSPIPFFPPGNLLRRESLEAELSELVTKEAVEPAPRGPGFYSRIFVVPKSSGGWRPVIDLSALNRYLVIPSFSMETAESIRSALPVASWVASLDLKDAYFHIPIHPAHRKYLRYSYQGRVWQFRALPFGLSPAPWIFTMVVKELQVLAHKRSIFLHQYLDDWIIRHSDASTLSDHLTQLVRLGLELGFRFNWAKSELLPSRDFVFVGYRYLTVPGIVLPSEERIAKIKNLASSFLLDPVRPAWLMQSFLGLLSSTEKLVPLGRLHMRELQWDLRSQWSQADDSEDTLIRLSQESIADVRWWIDRSNLTRGSPLRPPSPSKHLFTDASLEGWGAHLDFKELSGVWDPPFNSWHINSLELEAVRLALCHWASLLRGQVVLVATDNSTVVSYVNKQGGTRSLTLCRQVRSLLLWCWDNDIQVRARHIPGKLNVLADSLSRRGQVLPSEWSLAPPVFRALCHLWDTPLVDLFATRWNNKLPQYVSPIPDPQAWQVDALSMDWSNLVAYAYPPTPILSLVLGKVASSHCRVILIAPAWPDKSWFPDLLDLLIDFPRVLPDRRDLLKQPRSSLFHQCPSALHLHAWLLSSSPSDRKAFLQRCPTASPDQIDGLLWRSTSQSGLSSVLGVLAGRLILSKPLLGR